MKYITRFCSKTILHPTSNNSKTLINSVKALICNHFSTSRSPNPTPHSHNLLIENHLIQEFGFSKDKAISVSKIFRRSTTLSTLTAVSNFLKQNGFSSTHIKNMISSEPTLLRCQIDKTLKPKLKALQDIGFSPSSLPDFVTAHPSILRRSITNHIIPTINILQSILHSKENIVKVLSRSNFRGNRTAINVNFLRQCGIPDKQISSLLLRHPRIITRKVDWFKYQVDRVEKLGVKRDSVCFVYAFGVVGSVGEATLKEKFELFKSYGWSESDIMSAFGKGPEFLSLSKEKVRKMMSFLVDELEHNPKDIALMPKLLTYSLEKRLKPRSEVMKILYSRGLLTKKVSIQTIAVIPEKKFLEEFVVKFADRAPDVRAYNSSNVLC